MYAEQVVMRTRAREAEMEVRREAAHGTVLYRIAGKIDGTTSPNLESALAADEGSSRVILDMRGVTFISSAGLRVVVQAAKRVKARQGSIAVFGLAPPVKEVFDITRLGNVIPIGSDETEARSKLGA
jgi:anti-anti-sigma factor